MIAMTTNSSMSVKPLTFKTGLVRISRVNEGLMGACVSDVPRFGWGGNILVVCITVAELLVDSTDRTLPLDAARFRENRSRVRMQLGTLRLAVFAVQHSFLPFSLSSVLAPAIPLLIGDLGLSAFEERPSASWPQCKDRGKSAFRRMIASPATQAGSNVVLVDVRPMVVAIGCDALVGAWRHLTRVV